MLDAMNEGATPHLTPQEGRRVLQFALAAIASAREGREVRPDDIL